MRILLTLSFCCSSLAEMATELKKQKPLGGAWSVLGGIPDVSTPPPVSLHSHGRGLLSVVPRRADDSEAVLRGHSDTRVTHAVRDRCVVRVTRDTRVQHHPSVRGCA